MAIKMKKFKVNKNAISFTFFLLLSLVFWFLNALGKEYTTEIEYPVRFTNLPDNQAFIGKVPTKAKLKVSGLGFTLLQYKYSYYLLPFLIDLQAYKPIHLKGGGEHDFFIRSQELAAQFANHLGSELKLNSIMPDTLFLSLDHLERKKIPVLLHSKVTCKRQFMQVNRPIAIPDSIEIFGPRSVLDTLLYVKTKHVDFPNVSSSFSQEINLEPNNNVKYSKNTVKVFISVEKFTEAKIRLPIRIMNAPNTGKLMIFPNDITLYFIVSLNDYLNIKNKKDRFRAVVDYNDRSKTLPRMKVRITQFPASVRISRQNPLYVSYIIQNKKKKGAD